MQGTGGEQAVETTRHISRKPLGLTTHKPRHAGGALQAFNDFLHKLLTGAMTNLFLLIETIITWIQENPVYSIPTIIILTSFTVMLYLNYGTENSNLEPLDQSLRKYKNMHPIRKHVLDDVLPGAYEYFKEIKDSHMKKTHDKLYLK